MKTGIKLTAILAAAAISASMVLGGCSGGGSDAALDSMLEAAKAKVTDFESSGARIEFKFADEVFSKAFVAAMCLGEKPDEEKMQSVAKYLYLDSITVADENGIVTASYPDGEKGKKLKEIDGKKELNRIVRGMSYKKMTTPEATDDGNYTLFAGVPGAEGKGAVVIGITSSDYADVTGGSLAEKCGVNTIIADKDGVISSTLDGVEAGKTLDEIGVKDSDISSGTFTLKAGDKSYTCKAEKTDSHTVISSVLQ